MTAPAGGRLRLATIVAVSLLAVLAGATLPAAGHATLAESDPGNGETVEELPATVTLEYSGDGVQIADVSVTAPDGSTVGDEAEIDPDDDALVRVSLDGEGLSEEDREGLYTVEWEVLADDGHTTTGSFFFVVGDGSLDREAVVESYEGDDDPIPVGEVVSKAALLVGAVGLVGLPVTAWFALPASLGRSRAADRRLSALLAGATVLLAAGVLGLGVGRLDAVDGDLGAFVATPLGRVWAIQLLLVAGLASLTLTAVLGGVSRRLRLAGSFAGGVIATATIGSTSHSATAVDRLSGFAVDAAHVMGAGLWLGGLIVLATVLPALLRDTRPVDRAGVAAEAIRRYSIVALAGVTLAVATGFVLAIWHAPTVDSLLGTLYGSALSAKVLLVACALGLGGFTRVVALRRLEGTGSAKGEFRTDGTPTRDRALGTVRRAVGIESVVLVGVVLVSGLLTSVPTAVIADADSAETATVESEFDGGVLELSAFPATLERGVLSVEANEPVVLDVRYLLDGEAVASDRPVTVLAHNEETDTTIRFELGEEEGTYSTVQALPENHRWELRISGEPGGSFESEWVELYSLPEGYDRDSAESDWLTRVLGLGAIGAGVAGSLAIALESLRFGRRRREPL